MNVLMISMDRDILRSGSAVRSRLIEYGKLCESLQVVVFTIKSQVTSNKLKVADKVFIYPTRSLSRFFYVFNAYKIARKIIGNWKLEIGNSRDNCVVTSQDPFETGLAGWWLKRKTKIPLQLQIHTDLFSPHFAAESLLNRLRVWVARFLIPRADYIRVVSNRIKESLVSNIQYPISKITVLPIFVDVEQIRQTPVSIDLHKKYPNYDFIILMASRLTKEKNIGLAVKAMRKIINHKSAIINPLLLIVGSGPEEKNLKLLTYNLQLENNVIFESEVPFETLISYYKTADLYLLTSNYEGYGRTLVEAAAAGCSVVSTDVGIAKEIKGAKVVPVGDKNKLVAALAGENLEVGLPKVLSQDEYLAAMKKSWKACIDKSAS